MQRSSGYLAFAGVFAGLVGGGIGAIGQPNHPLENPGCPPSALHNLPLNACPQWDQLPYPLVPLPQGQSWINTLITPDRRPAAAIAFYEPSADRWSLAGNPQGLKSWWRRSGGAEYQPDLPDYTNDPSIPDQFLKLEGIMNYLYSQGFRRFILFAPAGSTFGYLQYLMQNPTTLPYYIGQDFSINQWYAMPEWKRQHFQDTLSVFQQFRQAHPSVTFELYAGAPLPEEACTLQMHTTNQLYPAGTPNAPSFGQTWELRQVTVGWRLDPITGWTAVGQSRWLSQAASLETPRAFDPRIDNHLARMNTLLGPWIGVGVRRFWLDAAVENRCNGPDNHRRQWGLHELAYNSYFRNQGVTFGGENIPFDNGQPWAIDMQAIRQVAYMALDSWLLQEVQGPPPASVTSPRIEHFGPLPWTPAQPASECHMLLTGRTVATWSVLGAARSYGYVLTVMNAGAPFEDGSADKAEVIERLKRWYSMGPIRVADFNGNGVVDSTDNAEFMWAYHTYKDIAMPERTFTCFAMGDINDDGKIDQHDLEAWNFYWNNQNQIVDYGEPRDL